MGADRTIMLVATLAQWSSRCKRRGRSRPDEQRVGSVAVLEGLAALVYDTVLQADVLVKAAQAAVFAPLDDIQDLVATEVFNNLDKEFEQVAKDKSPRKEWLDQKTDALHKKSSFPKIPRTTTAGNIRGRSRPERSRWRSSWTCRARCSHGRKTPATVVCRCIIWAPHVPDLGARFMASSCFQNCVFMATKVSDNEHGALPVLTTSQREPKGCRDIAFSTHLLKKNLGLSNLSTDRTPEDGFSLFFLSDHTRPTHLNDFVHHQVYQPEDPLDRLH